MSASVPPAGKCERRRRSRKTSTTAKKADMRWTSDEKFASEKLEHRAHDLPQKRALYTDKMLTYHGRPPIWENVFVK